MALRKPQAVGRGQLAFFWVCALIHRRRVRPNFVRQLDAFDPLCSYGIYPNWQVRVVTAFACSLNQKKNYIRRSAKS